MASKGEVGLDLDVSRVPLREADMEPFEIMISESQERMLCVVEPRRLPELHEVCERWDVRATEIGSVTDTRRLRVFDGDELVGDMPVEALVDDCPALRPRAGAAERAGLSRRRRRGWRPSAGAERDAARAAERALDRLEALRVRAVRPDRRLAHGAPAADRRRRGAVALANDGGSGAIAVSIDGNGRRVACDPYAGAAEAVLECARNLACVGAEPLGLTNCLNFGNPEKPHIAWQLTRAVEGLRDACLALGVPVVGGNVSLYNEGGGGPIYPTPIVGMVGSLPDPERVPRVGFAEAGHAVAAGRAVRAGAGGVRAGEAARRAGGLAAGTGPRRPGRGAGGAARGGPARRAGDRARRLRGRPGRRACRVLHRGRAWARASSWTAPPRRLFGEGPGGVVIAGPREAVEAVPGARVIGEVGGGALEIAGAFSVPLARLREAYEGAIPAAFG